MDDALNRDPDILVFTFTTSSRNDQSLLIFDDLYERRIRYLKGLVVLAPAGNDGDQRAMWPAGYQEVISVGALAADGRNRAHFSNYGKWVEIYAPGEGLTNAFPEGTYETQRDSSTGRTGSSTGWPSGAGRRSPPPWSPG